MSATTEEAFPGFPWLTEEAPDAQPDALSRPYWESVAVGGMAVPRCTACGRVTFPPRPLCPSCLRPGTLAWVEAGPLGHIHSFTICHRATVSGFVPPYPVLQVALDEPAGLSLLAYGRGIAAPRIGLPVRRAAPLRRHGIAYPVFVEA